MPLNRTVNANFAPRCQHTKANGTPCAAPARRGRRLCCFHDSAARRNRDFALPIIEDAHSLQIALNKTLQALLDKRIDQRTATTLLYGLQLALANMKELKHEQFLDKCDRERAQREAYAQAQAAAEAEAEEYEDEECEEEECEKEEATEAATIGNRQSAIGNAVPILRSPDQPITGSPDHPITKVAPPSQPTPGQLAARQFVHEFLNDQPPSPHSKPDHPITRSLLLDVCFENSSNQQHAC